MRDAAVIVWGIYLAILCVNLGFYFIGNSLSVDAISSRSIDFQSLNSTIRNEGEELVTGGFNPELIFGAFDKGTTAIWKLFSGGYLLDTLSNLGLGENFIFPFQAIVIGFLVFGAVIYYFTGRQ